MGIFIILNTFLSYDKLRMTFLWNMRQPVHRQSRFSMHPPVTCSSGLPSTTIGFFGSFPLSSGCIRCLWSPLISQTASSTGLSGDSMDGFTAFVVPLPKATHGCMSRTGRGYPRLKIV